MAINASKADVTGSVGNASQVVIIEQPGFKQNNGSDLSSPIAVAANGSVTGGDAHKFQGAPSNIDIAMLGALIDAGIFTGSLGRSPGYPGRLSVQNGIVLGGSPMIAPLVFRGLLQDKNPDWNILGSTGTTIPDEVNVVGDGTAGVAATDGDLAATAAITPDDELASTTNPVRLTVTLGNTPALATGKEFGRVRIKGTDHAGAAIAETFFFTADNLSDAQTGDRYFETVTSAEPSDFSDGNFTVTAQDTAVQVTITSEEEKAFCYHKLEVSRGLIPEVIDDNVIEQLVLALSADDVLRFAITYLGRIGYHQQNLGGDTGASARKTDASMLEYPTEDYWIGWQAKIFVEGLELAMADATATFQKQWTQPGTLGEQTEGAQPIASTFLGSITGNTIYATQNDFNENFVDNVPFSNIEIRLTNELKGGFKSQLRILGAKGQLNANPVPTIGDAGQILQSLEMNLLPSAVGLSDYIKIICDIPEYSPLRVFS